MKDATKYANKDRPGRKNGRRLEACVDRQDRPGVHPTKDEKLAFKKALVPVHRGWKVAHRRRTRSSIYKATGFDPRSCNRLQRERRPATRRSSRDATGRPCSAPAFAWVQEAGNYSITWRWIIPLLMGVRHGDHLRRGRASLPAGLRSLGAGLAPVPDFSWAGLCIIMFVLDGQFGATACARASTWVSTC